MNINDDSVLATLNNFIIVERLNKSQKLKMAHLAKVSRNISDLKDNLKWETLDSKY